MDDRIELTQADGLHEDLQTLMEIRGVRDHARKACILAWLFESLNHAEKEHPEMTIQQFLDSERRKIARYAYRHEVA
jgi:hypothetical protein